MKTIKKSDYVIYAAPVGELLHKAMVGFRIYNPIEDSVEIITEVLIADKKKNVGTWFNPKWEVFPCVKGLGVKRVRDNQVIEGHYHFNLCTPKDWVTKIIPERMALYNKLVNEIKILDKNG